MRCRDSRNRVGHIHTLRMPVYLKEFLLKIHGRYRVLTLYIICMVANLLRRLKARMLFSGWQRRGAAAAAAAAAVFVCMCIVYVCVLYKAVLCVLP